MKIKICQLNLTQLTFEYINNYEIYGSNILSYAMQ